MLPLLIVWPAVLVLLLLLGAQALLVSGARAHADAAASAGLRAVWQHAAVYGLGDDHDLTPGAAAPAAAGGLLADVARDAVADAAGGQGWRWWTAAGTTVRSDWCHRGDDASLRPDADRTGWVRVEVTGDVFGPFSALWPGRLDTVHASAEGPALLHAVGGVGELLGAPSDLPEC